VEKIGKGGGGGEEKILFFPHPSPHPASAPTLYRSGIQLQSNGTEPIYLAFRNNACTAG